MNIRNDGQIHTQAINLEGCTDAELSTVADHPAVHTDVRRMAQLILKARACRLAGDIVKAQRLEGTADQLYGTLPRGLRW